MRNKRRILHHRPRAQEEKREHDEIVDEEDIGREADPNDGRFP